ncbi:MAG: hypothetical protein J4G09_04265 [Proteobacteria bacterium]|nr:hypothetical protein [Pseudomonadota bacterium]
MSETVIESPRVKVELRHREQSGQILPRGYAHPAEIEAVRIAHVLASLVHEDKQGRRAPTIRSLHVYDLAEGLSSALGRASPDQEVVAATLVRDRRLGVFTIDRVTALRAAVEDDALLLEFFDVEWDLEDSDDSEGLHAYSIPLALPPDLPDFRLVAGEAQLSQGARGVRVFWRDDFYRRPMSLRVRKGRMKRRTVLLGEPAETESGSDFETPPAEELSQAQLRSLADLLEARREGRMPEAEFRHRYRRILEGRPDEQADPGNPPP